MTKAQKEEIKQIMEQKLREAHETIEDLQDAVKSVSPDNAIGRVSRMDAIGSKAVNDMALQKAKNKIDQLEYALGTWGTHEFGCCQMCMQEISFQRLSAMPEVTFCMSCASG